MKKIQKKTNNNEKKYFYDYFLIDAKDIINRLIFLLYS
jgi:hypothetical protein